jgi:hypothetical protein
LIVVRDRSVRVALLYLGVSPISVREAKLRIRSNGVIETGHCSLQIALLKLDIPRLLQASTFFGSSLIACSDQTYALAGEIPDFLFREEPNTQTVYEVLEFAIRWESANEVGTDEFAMEHKTFSDNQGNENCDADFVLCGGNDAVWRFDCETGWLAVGLVSFAIFVLTLAGQDHSKNFDDHLTQQSLAKGGSLANANSDTPSEVINLNARSASAKTASRQTLNVDHSDTISAEQASPQQTESPRSTLTLVPTLASRKHLTAAQANATQAASVHRQNMRSPSVHRKLVEAKLRLIELWRRGLAQNKRLAAGQHSGIQGYGTR